MQPFWMGQHKPIKKYLILHANMWVHELGCNVQDIRQPIATILKINSDSLFNLPDREIYYIRTVQITMQVLVCN